MDRRQARLGRLLGGLAPRDVNLLLLGLLVLAATSGAVAFALGGGAVVAAVVAHDVAGLGLVVLVPAKTAVSRRGLARRGPRSTWPSLVLAVLVAVALLSGVLRTLGLVLAWGPLDDMQVHVGAGLAALPLAAWHVVARDTTPTRHDLDRRSLLRAGAVLGAGGLALVATEATQRLAGFPGARRRRTGSFEQASHRPDDVPATTWLFDRPPRIDLAGWRLTVVDGRGPRALRHDVLAGHDDHVTAVLDCTSGWWSEQDWTGVRLDRLLDGAGTADGTPARSVLVRSATGYQRRFPLGDLDGLLLATHVGGAPLARRHGAPVRLVAPGRRGFWWVKWVDVVALDALPPWRQPPFPLQ